MQKQLLSMKTLTSVILLVSLFITLFSCKKDEEVEIDKSVDVEETSFEEVIEEGGVPEPVVEKEEVKDSTTSEEILPDQSVWKCVTKKVSVVDGNSEFPLFNPNASVIYPGSLLQGKTLKSASPSVIPVKRAGGTISIDIIDGSAQPSFSVEEVTKANIATAANSIINNSTGIVPANFNFTAEEIHSTEQLALNLGLDVQTQFVEVSSQFSFRKDKEYNRFLVKLNQSFYTLSFDIPTSVSGLFAPEVTPADLAPFVGPGNPATFISDVTYGRIYYMLIESSASSQAIEAAVNASFSSAVNSVDISLDGSHLSSLSELQIKVVALGGESKSTFATIGETNISALVTLLGESTDIRSGVPISYVVRSALDREVVSVKLATEYEVKNCVPLSTPVGQPILWFSADDLNPASAENPCTDCLEYNGKYRYYGPHDTYAREYEGEWNGTVVKKWRDISGNGVDASAVANDPDSRPIYVEGAFNNGKPAVDFMRGHNFENTNNRLTYSGGAFVNRDYTIFVVAAYPERVKFEWKDSNGNWAIRRDEANRYGYFMRGTSSEQNTNLSIGFQNASIFRLSHRGTQLFLEDPEFTPKPQFTVFALRFSKKEGMTIYENGKLIAKDATKKTALISYEGAMISAPFPGADSGFSRIRIGEIKAYGVAATEAQIQQETNLLNAKYGL